MEKIMRILLPFAMLISIANIAHAEVSDYLPAAKLKAEQFSQWNAGAGITQKLAHGNVEWVNPYGIAYAKIGAFINGEHEIGGF